GNRILERGVKGVAHGLKDMAAAGLDDPAQERVVAREGLAHRVGMLLPQAGAPLDVGKEECDGSGRQGTHDQGEESLAAIGSGSPGGLLGRSIMIVHLVDGTYELFRHFYGLRRFHEDEDPPFGAVTGVLHTVLQMIEEGAAHIGVATDHVIESFRNRLWSGYKTGDGVDRALLARFHPLEEALASMGVAVWRMTELEAEDAPPAVLGHRRDLALLFKKLATLRTDAPLFRDVDELRWRGPTDAFAAWAKQLGDSRLLERCLKASQADERITL